MIAIFEIALRLQNAQILPLDSWKAVPAHLDHLMLYTIEMYSDRSSATSSMVALDSSQLVLRISGNECID